MLKKYYENPKVTDDIEIDFYTPDASGCFTNDPYKINNIKVYFIQRDTNGNENEQSLVDQFDITKQTEYLEAQQLACASPTLENLANAEKLRQQFEATSVYNNNFYSQAQVVYTFGTATNAVWTDGGDNSNSPVSKITVTGSPIQDSYFKFIWSPNGSIREGDYYFCYTWTPNIAGDSYSQYLHFFVASNIANEVSNPSHVVDSSKYKNLLDIYLPEMYKMSYAKEDKTVETLDRLNSSIAEGFTTVDNLATQVVDITDANATQEPILGYLANFFGLFLRSEDVTLWRRQIKKAVPNFKIKGTLQGLESALGDAGINLVKYSQYYLCGSDNVWTETFTFNGSYSWTMAKTSLAINSTYFILQKRSSTGSYASQSLANISISTVSGVSTLQWTGPLLTMGDVLKLQYQVKTFSGSELTIYNIVKDLPLADLRDDADFDYPPKDWNTKVILEDDANFSTVISVKNPFVDYLNFGKVRTKFPYSENVYNMDEYNGSLRDSQNPCDVDKEFLEPCRNFISPYYSLDVSIKDLSNTRLQECQDIISEYTPFHAILHTLNFTGEFEDFVLPPVEEIEILVQNNVNDFVIAGMAQDVFNRAMFLGLQGNAVYRVDLATQITTSFAMREKINIQDDESDWRSNVLGVAVPTPIPIFSGTAQSYNEKINLYCSNVNFKSLGVDSDPADTLLEILSPSANSGEYTVEDPTNQFVTIPSGVTEPLNTSSFTFNLSNITLADVSFTASQKNVCTISDASVDFEEYNIKTVWDVDNGYAAQAWQIQLPTGTYNIADIRNNIITLVYSGTLSSSSATGVTYSLISPTETVFTSNNGNYSVEVVGKIAINPSTGVNHANEVINDDGFFYYDTTSDQYQFAGYVDGEDLSFLISGWDGSNGTVSGKTLKRLVTEQVGNLGYSGMKILKPAGFPTFADHDVFTNPSVVSADNENYRENYVLEIDGKNYCFVSESTVGMDTYLKIDGELINLGTGGTSKSFDLYRYGKNTVELFGQTLRDLSRNGQELLDQVASYSNSMMMQMAATEPSGMKDKVTQQEGITIQIQYADGKEETGVIK